MAVQMKLQLLAQESDARRQAEENMKKAGKNRKIDLDFCTPFRLFFVNSFSLVI